NLRNFPAQVFRRPEADDLQVDLTVILIAQGEIRNHDLVPFQWNHSIGASEPPLVRAPLECFLEVIGKIAFQSGIEDGEAAKVRDEAALIIERKAQTLSLFHNDGLHPPGPT